jgi:hypothetical protein
MRPLLLLALSAPAAAGPTHTHGAQISYGYQHLALQNGRVDLHGMTFAYEFHVGPTVGAGGRLAVFNPLSGKRDGTDLSLLVNYPLHLGFQVLVGPSLRQELGSQVHLGVVLGPEFDGLFLTSDSDRIRALTLGLGGTARVTYQLGEPWYAGLEAHAAFGFADLAGDGLHATGSFDVGLVFGLRYPVNWDRFDGG